ncbi:MAG: hypothetical protein ACF8R7_12165 [Phycisphaerales bacterium JB039]
MDPGTQAIAITNVIEAVAMLGVGIAEPWVASLLRWTTWSPGPDRLEWYEPTLLRLRTKCALGLSPDEVEVARLRESMLSIDRLMPALVALETVTQPAVLARCPLTSGLISEMDSHIAQFGRDLEGVRHEDQLYYYVLARKLPMLRFPAVADADAGDIERLARAAASSEEPGRVRRLGFTCDSLGALGAAHSTLLREIYGHLSKAVEDGACVATDAFVEDHHVPDSLQVHSALVGSYNASLVVRSARHVLGDEEWNRAQAWCCQLLRGAVGAPSNGLPASAASGAARNATTLIRWQGLQSASMGDEVISETAADGLASWIRDGRQPSGEVASNVAQSFDGVVPQIVVDELRQVVVLNGQVEMSIADWRVNAGGMLWLAMTYAGTVLEHDKVREYFGLEDHQAVSHLRSSLARRLDGIPIEAVIPPGKRGTAVWDVPDRGWTFLWLRRSADYSMIKPRRAKV